MNLFFKASCLCICLLAIVSAFYPLPLAKGART